MTNQESAEQTARRLFNEVHLIDVGGGFYSYLEHTHEEHISRKGLERMASEYVGKPLTLLVRNDVTDTKSEVPRKMAGCTPVLYRSSVLQLTSDYEADQAKALESKARKLQNKYSHK